MNDDNDRIKGLDQLARSRAPSRDLWPGIEARIKARRSRYPLMQFALAASLVAGMAGVLALNLRTPLPASPDAPQLSHDSRAIVQANLSIVRQSERQLRQALRQDPESATLRSLLASTENRQRALSALL